VTSVLSGSKTCARCGTRYPPESIYCAKDGDRLAPSADPPDPTAYATVAPVSDPYLGTIIHGDIEVRELCGVGAMGRVYRGFQRGTARDVAIKILNRELWGREDLVHRFYREARIASSLKHPHIVEVYMTGQLANGALYIVMEFLEGRTLAQELIEHGGALSYEMVLRVGLQLCEALGEAHKRGIVHRDLKPENVILVARGSAAVWTKVLDFGIAKASAEDPSVQTAAGVVFGTARYISPEAAQGRPVGPPGDVYSLAVMFYEMLSGKVPFDGQGVAVMVRHVQEFPQPLQYTLRGEPIPAPIVQVVMANLAKDPAQRAQTANALGDTLVHAFQAANMAPADMGRLSQPLLTRPMTAGPTPVPGSRPVTRAPIMEPTEAEARPMSLPTPLPDRVSPVPSRGTRLWPLLFTFLLGGAIAGGVAYRMSYAKASEHDAFIARAQHALTDGHYVTPPGENVKDLTEEGLKKWPNDTDLRRMRSQAESEMVTMAMAARTSGDVIGARNLARDAYDLDSTDNTARITKEQCEQEMRLVTSGGLPSVPKVVFESPALAKPGEAIEMNARIIAPPKAKITSVSATLRPNGKTTDGTPTTITQVDANTVRITLTAPMAIGSYDVTFQANVDGAVLLAARDLDVHN
jgi:serine/threonine protein kinase